MKQTIQRYISILLLIQMVVFSAVPSVSAQVVPTPPATPENTYVAPTAAPAPENTYVAPTAPAAPTPPTSVLTTTDTTPEETQTQENTTETSDEESETTDTQTSSNQPKEEGDAARTESATSASVLGVNPSPTPILSQSGQVGDASIKTGDATSTATVSTGANTNLSAGPSVGQTSGAQVANTGNGSNSTNAGSATIGNTDTTVQNNSAIVNTALNQNATTGSNDTSNNVGNSSIETGDANVTGTVITAVNTNVDGVMISEFNIADDHVGDILLDFGANCVAGCGGSTVATNSGNGAGSDNDASVDTTNNSGTFQNNDATIGSELVLSADSGNNTASANTGGDSNITTGDANVSGNVLTMANNNIAGDVVYAVVNIFGDLIGDILFTEEMMQACCGTNTTAANTGNGSDTTNDASVDVTNTDNTFQTNDADITNELVFDAQTGDNQSSRNTGGDSSISSGDATVDANVLNIANSNIDGGNMWLVIVNEAGNWIGKILGLPDDANFAGSAGTEFSVDENGFITASNNGNGSGSTNDARVDQHNTNTTVQNNDAVVNNSLNLSANTGGNEASNNTGGNSQIKTGDAQIIANLVNFVNNNITGNGKLFVTVVNVFGSWMGDLVTPGQKKEETAAAQNNQHVGGPSQVTTNTQPNQNTAQAATQQVPTQAPVSIQNARVMAAAVRSFFSPVQTNGESNPTVEQNTPAQKTLVKNASLNASVLSETDAKQKIRINLAWVAVLAPLFILAFGIKKILPKVLLRRS